MGGGHLGADAGFALGHDGEEEARDVDSVLVKFRRQILRGLGLAEHDRDDRVVAGLQGETGGAHAGAEAAHVVEQALTQMIAVTGEIDGFAGGGGDRRGQGVGEEIGARALAQEIDNGFRRRDIAAH